MEDLKNLEDIKQMVNLFYTKVRMDNVLGPVFESRINGKWETHLEKMYRFWQTVLLDEHTYHGSPFAPHANMPINEVHFSRWKLLFKETIDDLFTGELAEKSTAQAERMAEVFLAKLEYIQAVEK